MRSTQNKRAPAQPSFVCRPEGKHLNATRQEHYYWQVLTGFCLCQEDLIFSHKSMGIQNILEVVQTQVRRESVAANLHLSNFK